MPANKSYSTRERVLDRLLQREQGVTMAEMQEKINYALREAGFPEVSAQNTILGDLTNIANRYDTNIMKMKDPLDGRIIYYRYEDTSFSIYKVKLSEDDYRKLDMAKEILARCQGLLPSGWIEAFDVRLRTLMANEGKVPVIGFDTDSQYSGNGHLMPLYEAITKKQSVTITYAPFGYEPRELTVSPYFLRQSGHFWYLIASEKGMPPKSYGLDRISAMSTSDLEYEPCNVDLEQYFSNRVGVAGGSPYAKLEKVVFAATDDVWPYLEMAPIHRSQQILGWASTGHCIMQIEVCPTEELKHELCKYGGGITVIEPEYLRVEIAESLAKGMRNFGYKMDIDSIGDIITKGADSFKMDLEQLELEHPDTGEMLKVLNLAISKADFDSILDGSKTEETRSVKPCNAARYVNVDEEGFKNKNRDHRPTPVKYDAIQFAVYDDPDRPSLLVELKGVDIDLPVDEKDGTIRTYEYRGETWVAENITYHLGDVLFVEENGCQEGEPDTQIQNNEPTFTDMKTLNLIIKQEWFDKIMSGEKTQEFRAVKPTTVKKYIQIDENGYEVEDEHGNSLPIKYDAIRFYVGYNKDRDSALVEVKDAYVEMFVDEEGKFIIYEAEGKEWVDEQVVYCLGKVLEKNIHKK